MLQLRSSTARVLGLDVGGVLVERVAAGSDSSFFGDRPAETPMVAGALDAVRTLSSAFCGRVVIVSKAGPRVAMLTRTWLGEQGFLSADAVPSGAIHFVRRRVDKGQVCAALGVTHFVDDRIDVHHALNSVTWRYLFLGGLGPYSEPPAVPSWLTATRNWPETKRLILATLEPS